MSSKTRSILIDVRSPKEYVRGHIPGALSIPLFSDEERHIVGKTYKESGKEKAIALGLKIVEPKFNDFIELTKEFAGDNEVDVYCWRGGLRSASMCWLLNKNGFKAKTIKGGYKSWRRSVHSLFGKPWKFYVLGGLTGTSKTDVLHELNKLGEQVIDLEGIANHRGSAFGSMGEQPSTEHFENILGRQLMEFDISAPIWIEDESKNIGKVHLPDSFKTTMNSSDMIQVHRNFDLRVEYLCEEYGNASKEELKEGFNRISRKMGGQHQKAAIEALDNDDLPTACTLALTYYDRTYEHSLERSGRDPVLILDISSITNAKAAESLIAWKNNG